MLWTTSMNFQIFVALIMCRYKWSSYVPTYFCDYTFLRLHVFISFVSGKTVLLSYYQSCWKSFLCLPFKKTMASLVDVDKKKTSFWNSSFLVLTLCIATAMLHMAGRIVSKHLSHMNPVLYHWYLFLILVLLSQPLFCCWHELRLQNWAKLTDWRW